MGIAKTTKHFMCLNLPTFHAFHSMMQNKNVGFDPVMLLKMH